jgi:hypothetical protein
MGCQLGYAMGRLGWAGPVKEQSTLGMGPLEQFILAIIEMVFK